MAIRAVANGTGKVRHPGRIIGGEGSTPTPPVVLTYSKWNSADKDADVVLSGNDIIATVTAANGAVRGVTSKTIGSAGLYQVEFRITYDDIHLMGVGNSSASLASYPGSDANGWAYYTQTGQKYNNNSGVAYAVGSTQADFIGMTLNTGTGDLVFYQNGVSLGTAYSGLTGTLFPMWGPGTSGAGNRSIRMNTGFAPFIYPIAGADPWSGAVSRTSMWNALLTYSDLVLSDSNATVSSVTGSGGCAIGPIGKSSGSWYFEVLVPLVGSVNAVALGKTTASLVTVPGSGTLGDSYSYQSDGQKGAGNTFTAYGSTFTDGDVIGVHYNNGDLTFYKNGVSQGVAYSGLSGTYYPMWGANTPVGSGTIRLQASEFTQSIPSGAQAWGIS